MHCISKIVLTLLTILPYTFAYLDQPCYVEVYGNGACVKRTECVMTGAQIGSAGYSLNGCPDDPGDVVCCSKEIRRLKDGITYARGKCLNINECKTDTISYECPGSSNVKLCINLEENPKQQMIFDNAKVNVGLTNWAKWVDRQCKRNNFVYVFAGEPKCNLFVYEILLSTGLDIGTPNITDNIVSRIIGKVDRPPCAADWYDGKVQQFKYIGTDVYLAEAGDVITDGSHVAIAAGNFMSISAGEHEILYNDWGFREGQTIKIFRVKPNY